MAWNTTLTHLRDILATLYPLQADARRLIVDAGLKPAMVAFDARAINTWQSILEEADKHNKIIDIVRIAYEEYPANSWLGLAVTNQLNGLRGPDIYKASWKTDTSDDGLEKIISEQNTILPISFLDVGLKRSCAVARVLLSDGSCGTGFLVTNNLLLTNHHVLPSPQDAKTAKIQFNYQKRADGRDESIDTYSLSPDDGFATSPQDQFDWTAVHVKNDPGIRWGVLPLSHEQIQANNFVIIIQHPGGGPKQIALYHNVVTYSGNERIQYLTDTMPGSSGSPVFNSQWDVVGIHHSGGWLKQPGLNKLVYRNEGIPIHPISASLRDLHLL